jgi:hypothetical protein
VQRDATLQQPELEKRALPRDSQYEAWAFESRVARVRLAEAVVVVVVLQESSD